MTAPGEGQQDRGNRRGCKGGLRTRLVVHIPVQAVMSFEETSNTEKAGDRSNFLAVQQSIGSEAR